MPQVAALIPFLGPGNKQTPPPPSVINVAGQAAAEDAAATEAAAAEKRRRQLIAGQNSLIKTTPLGANLAQNKLGGVRLTGA